MNLCGYRSNICLHSFDRAEPESGAQHAGDPGAGAAYAKKYCTKCHAIDGTETSPEPTAPSFKNVANTKGMTATALTVWLTTSHPTMPNIVIEPRGLEYSVPSFSV